MKQVWRIGTALVCVMLLCSVAMLPAMAYPAGADLDLSRVVDDADLLTDAQEDALEQKALAIIEAHAMDLVIVTKQGLGGKTPEAYADDFFDYEGYGWRAEETDDITTGSGILLLVDMQEREVQLSMKGEGKEVITYQVENLIFDEMMTYFSLAQYNEAFLCFLNETEGYLQDYANNEGIYAPGGSGNHNSYNNAGDNYSGSTAAGSQFSGGLFLFFVIAGLIIAIAVVNGMKKKHNTIRTAQTASVYQQNFSLTEQQDVFLYSNTSRVALPQDTHHHTGGGGGGFGGGGGGSRVSSSGSSHSGGSRRF